MALLLGQIVVSEPFWCSENVFMSVNMTSCAVYHKQ